MLSSRALFLLVPLTLVCGCATSSEETEAGAGAVIGGSAANAKKFPFVVSFINCTGVKIGPRTLVTAAHCLSGANDPPATREAESFVFLGRNGKARMLERVVENVHPTYWDLCHERGCDGSEVGTPADVPGRADIAVVTLPEPTPEIPMVDIDFTPVRPGETLIFAGVGCTKGVGADINDDFHVGRSKVLEPSALGHAGSLYAGIIPQTAGSMFVTAGPEYPGGAGAGLCPGDSGGPVFREKNGKLAFVGVNSDYTFRGAYEAQYAKPVTNLHVRIDDESAHAVGAWLRSLLR